jgi:hypothetical protein
LASCKAERGYLQDVALQEIARTKGSETTLPVKYHGVFTHELKIEWRRIDSNVSLGLYESKELGSDTDTVSTRK